MTGRHRRLEIVLLILLILAAGLIRSHDLRGKSFWRDEIETHVFTAESLPLMTELALDVPHIPVPPLYLYLTRLFSAAGLPLRWPAFLFGVLLVPAVWRLGREAADPASGLAAAALTAISPFFVRYSQEARSYTLLAFLAVLAATFLYRAAGSGRKGDWLGFTLSMLLAMYTHFFALLLLPPAVLYLLLARRRGAGQGGKGPSGVLATWPVWALIGIAYWPMARPLIRGITSPRGLDLGQAKANLSVSLIPSLLSTAGPAASPWVWLVAILGAAGLMTRRFWRGNGRLLALLWGFLPLLLAAVIPFHHALKLRYLIYSLPFYYLAVAVGLRWLASAGRGRVRGWWAAAAVTALVTLSAGSGLGDYYAEGKQDWRSAALLLQRVTGPSDTILVDGRGERGLNLRYRVLEHYAGLGDRIRIVDVQREVPGWPRGLDGAGERLWYVNSLTPRSNGPESFFWGAAPSLEEGGWRILPPIKFDAPFHGSQGELWWIGPTRYRSVVVVPAFRETGGGDRGIARRLMDEARNIPGAVVDEDYPAPFPGGGG